MLFSIKKINNYLFAPRPLVLNYGHLEALKWLALVLMTGDHINYAIFKGSILILMYAGRLVLPIFAFSLAYALAQPQTLESGVYRRVMIRLGIAGIIATVPYVEIRGWQSLNILFSLLLGVWISQFILKHQAYQAYLKHFNSLNLLNPLHSTAKQSAHVGFIPHTKSLKKNKKSKHSIKQSNQFNQSNQLNQSTQLITTQPSTHSFKHYFQSSYGVIAFILFVYLGVFVEYFWLGPAVFLSAWYFCRKPSLFSFLIGVLILLSLYILNGYTFYALLAIPTIVLFIKCNITLPRIKYIFYIYYPLHLYVLCLYQEYAYFIHHFFKQFF